MQVGHHPRVLRLDPAVRPVWTSPHDLQLGIDPVVVTLPGVLPGVEHLVHALVVGTDHEQLAAIADAQGVDARALAGLLADVAPVLGADERRETPFPVAVDGPPDLASAVRAWFVPADGPAALGVVTAHHLIPPALTVRFLSADLPHLAVVFGDQAAYVGPFVLPGRTPCLRCADEHRLDDPVWRAIAAQLLRRRTSRTAASHRVRAAVAAMLGDAVESVREGTATGLEGAALRIEPGGRVSRVPRPWHAACSCRSASAAPAAAPAPSGTATPAAPPAAGPPSAPTTAGADPSPA